MKTALRKRRPLHEQTADDELWGARPPKQARSADVTWRIGRAAADLLASRPYHTVSVADIAAAAGISVGAVYTRFPTKEHVFVHLLGDLAEELVTTMQREMNPHELARCTVDEVVRRYLLMVGKAFVRHRALLAPATLIVRQTRDPQLQELMRRFNAEVHGRLRALLLDRLGRNDARSIRRIDTAILWSSAAMREVILYGEPVSSLSRRQTTLIEELTRGVTLYLEAGNR